jgi:sarcosine oxidase subunit gamma
VLAKGCRLDFHPRAFGPGRVAGATLAHVNAVIQQTSDLPKFRVIVLSSFAQHIAEWLEHATATA